LRDFIFDPLLYCLLAKYFKLLSNKRYNNLLTLSSTEEMVLSVDWKINTHKTVFGFPECLFEQFAKFLMF